VIQSETGSSPKYLIKTQLCGYNACPCPICFNASDSFQQLTDGSICHHPNPSRNGLSVQIQHLHDSIVPWLSPQASSWCLPRAFRGLHAGGERTISSLRDGRDVGGGASAHFRYSRLGRWRTGGRKAKHTCPPRRTTSVRQPRAWSVPTHSSSFVTVST
jgi:hypothetical protein